MSKTMIKNMSQEVSEQMRSSCDCVEVKEQ